MSTPKVPQSRAPTAFLLHPASALHDTGWGHPEHQGRLRALAGSVGKDMIALHGRATQLEPEPCDPSVLELVHSPEHVAAVRAAVDRAAATDSRVALDADTPVSAASWDAALGSVGACLTAATAVLDGRVRNAFVATRPPGHHATPDRAMGFCLFNNVAVAARWLVRSGRAKRVLIVDWDVHHGNGTQDVFWEDPSVFFVSFHQWPHWPGSGREDETGVGAGAGTTRNVTFAPGTPRATYLSRFEEVVAETRAFAPDFVLVSAGFDVLAGDPLGGQSLEPEDTYRLTRTLVDLSDDACDGRLIAVLEGGYDPARTGRGVVQVIRALAGVESGALA